MRAYLFACSVSNENKNFFGETTFIASCSRFAIDNPIPSVSLRCALYGNSREVMKVLKDADKQYGSKLKFDKDLYTEANISLPPVETRLRLGLGNQQTELTDEIKEKLLDQTRKPTIDGNETQMPWLKN